MSPTTRAPTKYGWALLARSSLGGWSHEVRCATPIDQLTEALRCAYPYGPAAAAGSHNRARRRARAGTAGEDARHRTRVLVQPVQQAMLLPCVHDDCIEGLLLAMLPP